MPCIVTEDEKAYHRREAARRRKDEHIPAAALCGILHALESDGKLEEILRTIDYKEAGVARRDLEAWYLNHKREDAKRRAREKAEANRKALVKSARAKLTPEERKALGLPEPD